MTPQQEDIVSELLSPDDLRFLAKAMREKKADIRREIFWKILFFINKKNVWLKLNLEFRKARFSLVDLEKAFKSFGVACVFNDNALDVNMRNISFRAFVDGSATIEVGEGRTSFMYSPDSIVRLTMFADEVLPDIESKLATIDMELDKNEIVGEILAESLRCRLAQTGRPFLVTKESGMVIKLNVTLYLKPDGKLSVTILSEKVDCFLETLDKVITSAETIYALFGYDAEIEGLSSYDNDWAAPYAPKANQP